MVADAITCQAIWVQPGSITSSIYASGGKDLPSHLLLSHNGCLAGCTASVSLLPETSSAVVVLANSMGLGDATGGILELLIESVLGGKPSVDYVGLAALVATVKTDTMERVEEQL